MQRAALLNALGYPEKYTTLTEWESREHALAFSRGSTLAAFVREHPREGVVTPSRPVEAYEVVHRVLGTGPLGAVYLIDEIVQAGPGNLELFEETRGAVYQLRRQFGTGFALSLLSRFLGGANRYLIFGAFNAVGDDQKTANAPEIRRYWEEHSTAEKLVPSAVRELEVLVKAATAEPL